MLISNLVPNSVINDVHVGIDVRFDEFENSSIIETYYKNEKTADEILLALIYAYQSVANDFGIPTYLAVKILDSVLQYESTAPIIPFSELSEPYDDTFDTDELPFDSEMFSY